MTAAMHSISHKIIRGILGFGLLCLTVLASLAQAQPLPTLTVGIMAYEPKLEAQARWQPLLDYLDQQVPHYQFAANIYHLDELATAVANAEVDFIFTHPAQYVQLTYAHQMTAPLATLVNRTDDVALSEFGGLVITRSSRRDINSLTDLAGKTVAAVGPDAFGAYQMQAFELHRLGLEPHDDYQLEFVGLPQERVIEAVLDGSVDAGFIRTGLVEYLSERDRLNPLQIKLIGAYTVEGFPHYTSTLLYPEWPFVALPSVDSDTAREVAAALLTLPHDGPEAQSMGVVGFTFPGDYRIIDQLLQALRLPPFDFETEVSFADVWARWQYHGLAAALVFFLLLATVITRLWRHNHELVRTKGHLEASNELVRKLTQAVEQSPESIVITDLNGRIEYVNQTFTDNTGYSSEEVRGRNPRLLQSRKTQRSTYQSLWRDLSEGRVWRGEFINRRKDGSEYHVAVLIAPVREQSGDITHYLAVEQDITEQKRAEERIHRLAFFDPLTGLPNRTLLTDELHQLIKKSRHEGPSGALLLLNIDRFKVINDARGNPVGDALLRSVGDRIQALLDDRHTVARMAADEFAVLLKDMKGTRAAIEKVAQDIANQIHSHINAPFELEGEQFTVTVSIGLTLFVEHDQDTSTMVIRRADMALHQAKAQGANQTVFFEAGMGESVAQNFQIEGELRQAIERNELRLYLQPQMDAKRCIVGAEALVRWMHPQRGMISPGVFIPVAEQSDLIVDIGKWVMREAALLVASRGQRDADFRVAVNLSPRHFRKREFVPWLHQLIAETGARPDQLMLEITEGLLIDNFRDVVAKINELTAQGFAFSIDDFGTGYSSLAYLQRLPIQELKIDQSFIRDSQENAGAAALVDTILAVAERMELAVVAEGVETYEQAEFLFARAPDIIQQGYLYSRPQPAESVWADWASGRLQDDNA